MLTQIEKSTAIVIIGGGAVGIELAGEILDRYPKKSITIIQSGDKLLSNATDVGDKIKVSAKKALEDKGVKIVLSKSKVETR